MRLLAYFFMILLFSTNVYAVDPFVAICESGEAHRYDIGNGLDNKGDKMDQSQGWMTEVWWEKDNIIWDGGNELRLKNGEMRATIINNYDDVISAIYSDMNNVYSVILDTKLGKGILTQQQKNVMVKQRQIMSRTIGFECQISK
jgi:hypothetical protein